MTRPGDPRGYYARLGVATWATPQAIDAAFKARSRELHPERNPAPDAPQRYQGALEAYQLLSDERRRREYDADAWAVDDGTLEAAAVSPIGPAADRVPWFRRKPVAAGIAGMAALLVAGVVIVRAPSQIVPSPARALTPPPILTPPRFERRTVNASGLNLRMGPGMEHEPTSRIARGESVELLQPETDGWVRIRLGDGRTGYVATRFLTAP